MKPREFWIEFEGDPHRDHQFVKRYVYGQEFEPNHLSSEVIHVREVMREVDVFDELMTIAKALIGSDPWQWDAEDQKLFERFKEIQSGEDKPNE